MPSTRRQKAKASRSREMNMMSEFDNLDVMVGSDNPNGRELASAIEEPSVQNDTVFKLLAREDFPQEIEFRIEFYGNNIPDMTVFCNQQKL